MKNSSNPIILFDGICNLCNNAVQFVIRHDRKHQFRFASLQSDTGRAFQQQFNIHPGEPDSVILIYLDKMYIKSRAALMIIKMLGGPLALTYGFILVPRLIRDGIYNWIAKNRYKWFGKKDSCMIPDKDLSYLFLD